MSWASAPADPSFAEFAFHLGFFRSLFSPCSSLAIPQLHTSRFTKPCPTHRVVHFEGYAGPPQSPRRGRQTVAPGPGSPRIGLRPWGGGVSLGKTIESSRISPLERAQEALTIPPSFGTLRVPPVSRSWRPGRPLTSIASKRPAVRQYRSPQTPFPPATPPHPPIPPTLPFPAR
jgi:hypothetical protein